MLLAPVWRRPLQLAAGPKQTPLAGYTLATQITHALAGRRASEEQNHRSESGGLAWALVGERAGVCVCVGARFLCVSTSVCCFRFLLLSLASVAKDLACFRRTSERTLATVAQKSARRADKISRARSRASLARLDDDDQEDDDDDE